MMARNHSAFEVAAAIAIVVWGVVLIRGLCCPIGVPISRDGPPCHGAEEAAPHCLSVPLEQPSSAIPPTATPLGAAPGAVLVLEPSATPLASRRTAPRADIRGHRLDLLIEMLLI